jgi:hypothetical protein
VRGLLGFGIGLIVGAGAMYLTLRPPWSRGEAPAVAGSAGSAASAKPDAGVPGKAKPRPRARPARGGGIAGAPGAGEGEDAEGPAVVLTDDDRRLEWRGDEVVLPPRKIDLTSPGGDARPLDDGEINAVIAEQSDGVKDCVIRGAIGTDLRAAITVKLLVDGNGRVTRSGLMAPRYLFGRGLLACAQRALGRMRFPATGAPTVVTLPVDLG